MTEKQSTPAAQQSERELRYTPGKNYPFVHCKFTRSFNIDGKKTPSRPSSLGLYCPWNLDHTLLCLEVVQMVCMEHHKVRNEWDKEDVEPKYDGFIFSEYPVTLNPPSRRWFNQFPRASYGQLDDSADRHLHLDWKGCGMNAKEAIAVEESPTGRFEMHDGIHFLGNIRRGQVTIAKSTEAQGWKAEDKAQALEALVAFEKRVQALMEEAMGKKLKIKQVMYEPAADGREPILMDWFDVVFDDEPEYSHTRWEDGRGQRRLITPVETLA